MKKNLIKTSLVIIYSLLIVNFSYGIIVQVPPSQGQENVVVPTTTIQSDEGTIFELIQTINQYLWFSIGAICMGVLVFGGIKLMTSQGNQEKMKQANKLLTGALVGILIAILSYAVVRLIVNLF